MSSSLIIMFIILLVIAYAASYTRKEDKTQYPKAERKDHDKFPDGGKSDIEELREYYCLSKRKMKFILARLGISSSSSSVSQEQREKIIREIEIEQVYDELKESVPSPQKEALPLQQQPKPVAQKSIEDKGHKILQVAMTALRDDIISRSVIPSEGSQILSDKGKEYVLGSLIGSPGGEGSVYSINNSSEYVAKIYNFENCTARRREKLAMMIRAKLKKQGICFPREILYTSNREFTGYVMPKANGSSLVAFFNSDLLNIKFPGLKKIDMVQLSITILRKISYLHNQDIIIGDVNPSNILVVSPDEVYFIDTDSYQYRGFPCPVGISEYTAPEIQGRDFRNFLRTQGNENFTVAILLFRLMMWGQSPYAYQGGGNPVENIMKGIFPYAAYGRNVPNVYNLQPLRFRNVWSYLYKPMKEAFWDTFHKDGAHNTESTRYNDDMWMKILRGYLGYLPKLAKEDPEYNELIPKRLNPGKNSRVCSRCGERKSEQMFYNATTCLACHEEIRHEVYTTLTCVNCGRTFPFTNGEHEHYEKMGFTLPKRCPECRN